jgi:hypothetical protein
MDITEHFKTVGDLLSKYKQYDYTIDIFNESARRGQMDAIAYRLGSYAGFKNGGQANGVFRTSNDSIMQDLAPLQKVQSVEVVATGNVYAPLSSVAGFAEFPSDCYQITSLFKPYNSSYSRLVKTRDLTANATFQSSPENIPAIDFKILEQDQFINRCSSAIAPPTERYPIGAYVALEISGQKKYGVQVAPLSLIETIVNFAYIADPEPPIYIADYDADNVNFTLPSSCDSELVWRVARYIAISFRDDKMIAYANTLKPNNIVQ